MIKKTIYTKLAPTPIGPYSQGVLVDSTLYVSGQIAIDKVAAGATIQEETQQVLDYLIAIVEAAEMSTSDIVKCSIFVKNMNDFAFINEVYGNFFTTNPPARETIEVARLPRDVNIEISCIAVK